MFREGISFSVSIALVFLTVRPAECGGFPNVVASEGKIWPQPQVILEGDAKKKTSA